MSVRDCRDAMKSAENRWVRSRDRVTPPALYARKEVQLGSGAIHEFREETRVRACSCTPVRALMRATVSRLCACTLHITVHKYPEFVRFPKKKGKKKRKVDTFLSAEFFGKLSSAYTVLHVNASKYRSESSFERNIRTRDTVGLLSV